MAGFKASSAVSALDYDFRPVVEAQGTVPEPTREQLATFRDSVRDIFGTTDEAEIDARIGAMSDEEMRELEEQTIAVIAEFCQGSPTAEQIQALPPRHQQAFFGWLIGEFSPRTTRPDMNGSRATPTSA